MNRPYRQDRLWRDPDSVPLGESNWDGKEEVISAVTEYGDNSRPKRIWTEPGDIAELFYDGADRPVGARSENAGMSLFVGYDENNNPERIEFAADLTEGSEVHPLHQTYLTAFDEMDRPEGRFVNDEPKSFVEYNDLGQALSFQDADGDRVYIIHDEFGRQAGRAVQVERPDGEKEWLIERIDRYDDGLVNARVDADGEVYDFDYDELGRRTHIEYPNGTVKTIGYDDDGNVNRIKDQNGTVIDQVFDSLGRLERREVTPIQGEQTVEIYEFDAINRLVTLRQTVSRCSGRMTLVPAPRRGPGRAHDQIRVRSSRRRLGHPLSKRRVTSHRVRRPVRLQRSSMVTVIN